MLTLLLAAAASLAPSPAAHSSGPRVTSLAQASVRIVRAARIDFDHPQDLGEAQIHTAVMRVDGVPQQARLIEFQ